MRKINYIVIHCTATPQTATIESMQRYWKESLKWKRPGYHYVIKPSGEIVNLLPVSDVSNGVGGWNSQIINISYIGGVDAKGNAFDNRTTEQKAAIVSLLKGLRAAFPNAIIQGHRDFKGVRKDCPSFDAKKEYSLL